MNNINTHQAYRFPTNFFISSVKLAGIFTPIFIFSDKPNNYACLCFVLSAPLCRFPVLECVCARVCACHLRYGGTEWTAACPSPPAEAELVTVYWLGNIRCLQGVCSRWSKLAEWLWQTHGVHCCCKVNNKLSQSVFVLFVFFFFHNFFFCYCAQRLVTGRKSQTTRIEKCSFMSMCVDGQVQKWDLFDFLPDSVCKSALLHMSIFALSAYFVYSPSASLWNQWHVFAINSAPSRTPPKASFAATPAEIAGAADKIQPNKYVQCRLPHSSVKMLPAVRKKKVTVHTGVIFQFFPPLLKNRH